MTSLVTGGAGFIGSHVAEELSKSGETVVSLDDLSGGFLDNVVGDNVTFVKGSITDVQLINNLFDKYHFDYVYHLAAYAAEGLSHFIKRFNYENNLIGSVNLINAAVNFGVKTFVFTSSIAVYGHQSPPMQEEMMLAPADPYGIAKAAVEEELRVSHEMFGLNYVIFRPHNVYGERQNIGDRYRNVIGIFMNQIMQAKPLTIFGDGEQKRAFTHVSDVAPIIARSVHVPGALNQVFNIGADQPYTINYLAETIAQCWDLAPEIVHLPPRNEVVDAYSSHNKLKAVFNPLPPLALKDGIERMAKWAKSAGPRKSNVFSNIEIARNMPPSWIHDIAINTDEL